MSNPFTSKTKARRKWRQKALLMDPHKSRLILVATSTRSHTNKVPLSIRQKLLQTTTPRMQDQITITPAEYAFADRSKQEMLERGEPETPQPENQQAYIC